MKVFQISEYDHIGVYSFAYKQDDVIIYPDSIEVKVALDNGEVLGIATQNYLMNHHKRDIKQPKLSMEEAKEHVSEDRKSTRLNSSHVAISYAAFCLKKKISSYNFYILSNSLI